MGKSMSRPRLLIVDDNQDICDFLRLVSEGFDFDIIEVTSATAAIQTVTQFKPNLIFLDLCMPDMDGVELISELAAQRCDASICLVSGMDQRTLSSVQSLGTDKRLDMLSTLTKPMTIDDVEAVIKQFLKDAFLSAPPAQPKQNSESSSMAGFGLQIDYEPEFHPQDADHNEATCLRARPLLRMDTGASLEETGLYSALRANQFGQAFFKSQCREILHHIRHWQSVGFHPTVTLGVPAFIIENAELPKLMETLLSEHGVASGAIAFELFDADSAAINSKAQEVLSRLRLKGIRIRTLLNDGDETALSDADKLPIDEFMVDLGSLAQRLSDKADIETEFLYSSLNSVANRKGIRVCAANVNTSSLYALAQQCRFNALRGSKVYVPVAAADVLAAHESGRLEDSGFKLLQPA